MMNEKYDYRGQVYEDVAEYIKTEIDLEDWSGDREGLEEQLNEELWTADRVTGNGSGSYFCNTWRAEEALAHNWGLLEEAAETFGAEPVIGTGYENGAEYWDVTIRCYLLPEMISRVLDDLEESGALEEPEEPA